MPIRIFISHSVGPKELVWAYAIAEEAARRKITPSLPDRDWNPNRAVPKRIRKLIEDSDYIIAIATKKGHHFQWLNAEIIYSQQLSPKKPLLLVIDTAIKVDPSYERVIINYSNPLTTISEISHKIRKLIQDRDTQDLFTKLLVGGLTLLFLYSAKEE